MAANTLKDAFVDYVKDKKQIHQTVFAKIIVFVYGAFAVAVAFVIKELPGPITQISYTTSGATGGPLVGMIMLGAFFPQANWIGAMGGGVIGIAVNVWIAVGGVMYGTKTTSASVPIPTSGCYDFHPTNSSNNVSVVTSSVMQTYLHTSAAVTNTTSMASPALEDDHLALYDLSYAYLGMVGFFVSLLSGLIVNLCTGKISKPRTDPSHVFPFIRRLCKRFPFDYGNKQDGYDTDADTPTQLECLTAMNPNIA